MSAIDTLEHAHVKNFFGIPVYWVLQDEKLSKLIDNASEDKIINQFYLSVGGGSGEHSALILNNDAVILNFLKNINEPVGSNAIDRKIFALNEKIDEHYMSEELSDINGATSMNLFRWQFDQNQWPLETFIEIHREMSKIHTITTYLQETMMDAFAMLIIYNMPLKHCLHDPDLIEIATLIKDNKWDSVLDAEKISTYLLAFENIEKHKNGKVIRNNEVVWGYSLEDWHNENNPIELSEKLSTELVAKSNTPKIKI